MKGGRNTPIPSAVLRAGSGFPLLLLKGSLLLQWQRWLPVLAGVVDADADNPLHPVVAAVAFGHHPDRRAMAMGQGLAADTGG